MQIQNEKRKYTLLGILPSILPAGYYNGWDYSAFGASAFFWSATGSSGSSVYDRHLYYDNAGVYRGDYFNKYCGFSVRCVRD